VSITYKLSDIDAIAKDIIALAKGKNKFALYGNLGAGKTTLVGALCKCIGVTEITSSPTFAIIQEYIGSIDNVEVPVAHMDWYRLQSLQDLHSTGVLGYLHNQNTYCFIEWPNNVLEAVTDNMMQLHLTAVDDDTRQIDIR
jgi:tRNA threonylcarbamoyladenosine biosynthesis protein TsaE